MNIIKHLGVILIMLFSFLLSGQERTDRDNQDEELGKVSWFRDYDLAMKYAARASRSILILFQEVPGCATCKNYGNNVLSHPLMVEALENEFIPLVIYNNAKGRDLEILQLFDEPTWNNPVVRIVDKKGENIVNRLSADYTAKGLYDRMEKALLLQNRKIPEYFEILGEELHATNTKKTAYYTMYCFWSGEAHFGKKEGVLSTEAGFMAGHEVVKVEYDESIMSKRSLDKHGKNGQCHGISFDNKYRKDKDPQYYLKRSNYKFLPLSNLQKTKINASLKDGLDPLDYLSPKQNKWLQIIEKEKLELNPNSYDEPFMQAWTEVGALHLEDLHSRDK